MKRFDGPTDIRESYDAIVIGAGIGGLFAANFLAQAGVSTLLIERHYEVGGYLQGGWRRGFYFDYGTQSNEIKGAILPALQMLGLEDRVKFHQCHHRFTSSDGLDLELHKFEDAEPAFAAAYPESADGVRRYFEYFRGAYDCAKALNEEGVRKMVLSDSTDFMPDYHGFWKDQPYYEKLMDYDKTLSWQKCRTFFARDRLSRILTHFGYRNQSALLTGLFWHLWCDDYFYNEGGKQNFMDMLAEAFIERGGTLAMSTGVDEILVEDKTACGVRLEDGRVVKSTVVISNADLRLTLGKLLREHEAVSHLKKQADETPVSESFFTVFLGTSIPVEELREVLHDAHHTWNFPTHNGLPEPFDVSFHGALPMEISAPILHDPKLAQNGSGLVLQTFSYLEWMSRWRLSPDGKRRRIYRTLKAEVEEQLIENAARVIPNLRERMVYMDSASPLTLLRYTANAEGATAGWTWNRKRTMVKLEDQLITLPIKNLFCAGHWVLYPGGLLTATLAGKIAADLAQATLSGKVSPETLVANTSGVSSELQTV